MSTNEIDVTFSKNQTFANGEVKRFGKIMFPTMELLQESTRQLNHYSITCRLDELELYFDTPMQVTAISPNTSYFYNNSRYYHIRALDSHSDIQEYFEKYFHLYEFKNKEKYKINSKGKIVPENQQEMDKTIKDNMRRTARITLQNQKDRNECKIEGGILLSGTHLQNFLKEMDGKDEIIENGSKNDIKNNSGSKSENDEFDRDSVSSEHSNKNQNVENTEIQSTKIDIMKGAPMQLNKNQVKKPKKNASVKNITQSSVEMLASMKINFINDDSNMTSNNLSDITNEALNVSEVDMPSIPFNSIDYKNSMMSQPKRITANKMDLKNFKECVEDEGFI